MKTTLEIDDGLARQLREEASRRDTTVSALVEEGLRHILEPSLPAEQEDLLLLPTWDSGGALVDVANREELYEVLDAGSNREKLYRM